MTRLGLGLLKSHGFFVDNNGKKQPLPLHSSSQIFLQVVLKNEANRFSNFADDGNCHLDASFDPQTSPSSPRPCL
jgi:hypothetical protein